MIFLALFLYVLAVATLLFAVAALQVFIEQLVRRDDTPRCVAAGLVALFLIVAAWVMILQAGTVAK